MPPGSGTDRPGNRGGFTSLFGSLPQGHSTTASENPGRKYFTQACGLDWPLHSATYTSTVTDRDRRGRSQCDRKGDRQDGQSPLRGRWLTSCPARIVERRRVSGSLPRGWLRVLVPAPVTAVASALHRGGVRVNTRPDQKLRCLPTLRRGPATPAEAWRHVYQLLLSIDRTTGLAHCYESDKCQPGRHWYGRSLRFHDWMSQQLDVAADVLAEHIDWLFSRASADLAAAAAAGVDYG